MKESIDIIRLYDDVEVDCHNDEAQEFSVCIIGLSCISSYEQPFLGNVENIQKNQLSEPSSLNRPYKIYITTRTSKSEGSNAEQSHSTNHQGGSTVVIALPSASTLSALHSRSTQTEPDSVQCINTTAYPDIFFCTFHKCGDVETLCKLNCGYNSLEKGVKRQLEDHKDNCSLSSLQLENGCISVPHCYENKVSFNAEKAGSLILTDENAEQNSYHTDEIDIKKIYSLRSARKRKLKKWNSKYLTSKYKILKTNIFKCVHCTESFSTYRELVKHSEFLHNSTTFSFNCKKCSATFTRPHNLMRHIYAKHTDGFNKVVCDICGREFSRQDVLITHKRLVHANVKNHEGQQDATNAKWCDGCQKYFYRGQNFNFHQSGDLTCSKCLKVYLCKSALKNHLANDHSASCTECGKICSNERQLYLHRLKHSPKYKCDYCNKGFSLEYQLIIHLATHTGNKPLMCEICGRSYAHKNSLHKHKWQEHTEANKKFKCAICGRGFVYKAKLESHLKSHSGDKPFVCHICPSSFSQNCSLASHIKAIHGVYVQSNKKSNLSKAKSQLANRKVVKVSSDPEVPQSKNSFLQNQERNLVQILDSKFKPKNFHFRTASHDKKENIQFNNKVSILINDEDPVASIAAFSIM